MISVSLWIFLAVDTDRKVQVPWLGLSVRLSTRGFLDKVFTESPDMPQNMEQLSAIHDGLNLEVSNAMLKIFITNI